jgi:hypothetical protein
MPDLRVSQMTFRKASARVRESVPHVLRQHEDPQTAAVWATSLARFDAHDLRPTERKIFRLHAESTSGVVACSDVPCRHTNRGYPRAHPPRRPLVYPETPVSRKRRVKPNRMAQLR